MTQVATNGAATQKGQVRGKGTKADAEMALTATTVASQLALHAGTVWTAKLSFGLNILASDEAGIKREDLFKAVQILPASDLVRVRGLVNVEDFSKFESMASKLAKIASMLARNIKSPDGKHTVTVEQAARWNLSTEDAAFLARKLTPKKDGSLAINVSTLVDYCKAQDGGKAKVRKWIDSNKPQAPSGSSNGKAIKGIAPDVQKAFLAAVEKAGVSASEYLKNLMADAKAK